MTDTNLLIIMDDEHSGNALGCAGHPFVKTPNLDRLAARGTRFRDAYTNSPICVPARAALVTGEYPHKTGCWDNCIAYDGKVRSRGHELQDAGLRTDWIGKLHYLQKPGQLGFDREQLPMRLLNHGDTHGLIRDPLRRPHCQSFAEKIGPGETEYIEYDRAIRDTACQWLP
ncbi:sulfatase-like hydrolase/transferase [Leisingera thetidis]|uniref:sulfatase-like hydrolase/transferase n=1 Tax=Leisingera thetidis TaxID=2930199 RepID=UPI0021F78220|nr:sulfatase-like hydrolase/transferase [Leisingera thetidis]